MSSKFAPLAAILLVVLAASGSAAEPQLVAGLRVREVSAGALSAQEMAAFPQGTWHRGDQLWWTGAGPGDRLVLDLPVENGGPRELNVTLTRAPDYGMVQFSLDGRNVGGRIDLCSALVAPTPPIPLGIHELAPGEHALTVEIVGANEKATGTKYMVGVDRIALDVPGPPAAAGDDAAALIEALYRLDEMPRLRPGTRTWMFSSFDRTGGNNDGFAGVYSNLWIEDGDSVLARMQGAGAIQRIWFTHSGGEPGLLGLKGEHVRVYVDGQSEPALDVPLEEIFSGRLARFPRPLVGEGQGGFYCYVPIAYRDGCKVVVDGTDVHFYQITYREFPSADGLASFRIDPSPREQEALAAAVRLWSRMGRIDALGLVSPEEKNVQLALAAAKAQDVKLPAGPRMVRAVRLEGSAAALRAAAGAELEIRWDGADKPAASLPIEYLFAQAFDPPPFRSLLAGTDDTGWYNFMPMPYHREASLRVTAAQPIDMTMKVITTPLSDGNGLGYFHAVYREDLPTTADRHYQFVERAGRGHYAGTYLATEGQAERRLPLWLEGDDRFTADGHLDIHGTGSEDYFNCGWYALEGRLNGPGAQPLHGFPVYRLDNDMNRAAAFRWHVSDPVHYDESLVAEIEHGADNRQEANYRSAAFFYEAVP